MNILITGFDPFGGECINPALEAVKALPNKILGVTIDKLEIPTVFYDSAEKIKEEMKKKQYDVVVNIGQAGGRFHVTPERVAINIDDARIPDNKGNQPIDQKIQEDGKSAYFSTLPIKAMVEHIQKAGYPASISNSAGTFVCNHVMYQTLYLIEKEYPKTKAGFIHVPYIPEQVLTKPNQPFMHIKEITLCLEKAIEAIIHFYNKEDLKTIGGTTH